MFQLPLRRGDQLYYAVGCCWYLYLLGNYSLHTERPKKRMPDEGSAADVAAAHPVSAPSCLLPFLVPLRLPQHFSVWWVRAPIIQYKHLWLQWVWSPCQGSISWMICPLSLISWSRSRWRWRISWFRRRSIWWPHSHPKQDWQKANYNVVWAFRISVHCYCDVLSKELMFFSSKSSCRWAISNWYSSDSYQCCISCIRRRLGCSISWWAHVTIQSRIQSNMFAKLQKYEWYQCRIEVPQPHAIDSRWWLYTLCCPVLWHLLLPLLPFQKHRFQRCGLPFFLSNKHRLLNSVFFLYAIFSASRTHDAYTSCRHLIDLRHRLWRLQFKCAQLLLAQLKCQKKTDAERWTK